MMQNIDARMTFDSFVVGPGNRLASAAARRAADSPAASYNPLFLYSASGLGKSHILNAMAHHSERLNPDSHVLYQTLEGYLDELAEAIQRGTQEELKDRYRDLDILLLDDVQFLTGQSEAQELLLRTLDSLNLSGSQIVLASDRPPAEIDGLDARLLSRFSGGLMVDIAPPELETRVAIIRKKCEGRKAELAEGVSEQIARLPFRNVRELMGGLNRVLAAQELEGRAISAEDVIKLVDIPVERPRRARRADRLSGSITPDLFEAREEPWQRLIREAAEEAEAEGFATGRLRRVLDGEMEPTEPEKILADFHGVLDELRQIRSDLDVVGNPWPEAARGVLLDPDRVEEARALLASARERVRDFPPFPLDLGLHQLEGRYPAMAVKAAHQLITDEPPEYNPLYVWSPDGHGARTLLEAAGASCLAERPTARVAFISAKEFAEEFIDALSDGVAGAWRERWWTVELLLVHGCQELSQTERAQDEFFHLFEAVKRRGARVFLGADRSPSNIDNIDDRLRSRFEGGLVVETNVTGLPPTPVEELLRQREKAEPETLATDMDGLDEGGEVGPDLQVRVDDMGQPTEEANPEFDRALDALDGGSERAAWAVPAPGTQTPEALTNLTVRPDDFPTLLSQREKERKLAGVDPTELDPFGTEPSELAESETSGEVAATTESVVEGPPSEAALTSRDERDVASSEVASPGIEVTPEANLETAPIVTAADLLPPVADPAIVEPPAVAEPPVEEPHVAATVDTAPEDAPPVQGVEPTTVQDAALDDGALDDGALDDASPTPEVGPWVAEALPAVLEDELDHVIDTVFAAHTNKGEATTEAAPDGPAMVEPPSTPLEAVSTDAVEAPAVEAPPLPEPVPSTEPDPSTEPRPSTQPPPSTESTAAIEAPQPVAPVELPDVLELTESLVSDESEVLTGGYTPGANGSTPGAQAGTADYGFESSPDAGVATRTRTRHTHQVDAVPAAADVPAPTPEIDAAPESQPAAPTKAQDQTTWVPSPEKTVWDWPSLEARMVVED